MLPNPNGKIPIERFVGRAGLQPHRGLAVPGRSHPGAPVQPEPPAPQHRAGAVLRGRGRRGAGLRAERRQAHPDALRLGRPRARLEHRRRHERGVDLPDRPGGAPRPGRRRCLLRLLQQPVLLRPGRRAAGSLRARLRLARGQGRGRVRRDRHDHPARPVRPGSDEALRQGDASCWAGATTSPGTSRTTTCSTRSPSTTTRRSRTGRGSSTSSSRAWPSTRATPRPSSR